MPDTALVIGIDNYGPEDWRLGGAVRDALTFARWLTTQGGVRPENLLLLSSPTTDASLPEVPAGVVQRGEATHQAIIDAVAELQSAATGGDRLWVYYAGHGASVRWSPEPVLIPVDFSDPQRHGSRLIGFSQVIPALVTAPFAEQLFLIDACRDFALANYRPPAVRSSVGAYSPAGDEDVDIAEERPRQYVLYSVAPGKRALELGSGIWTTTLLEGLGSRSYQVMERGSKPGGGLRWELRLDAMSEWLRRRVAERIARIPNAAQSVQRPEYVPDPRGGDPLLLAYALDEAPRVQVDVFVDPEIAWQTCRLAVLEYDGAGRERETQISGPPIQAPASFSLLPSHYSFRAEAQRYGLISKPWTVDEPPTVELTLEEVQEPEMPEMPPPPAMAPASFSFPLESAATRGGWHDAAGEEIEDFEEEADSVGEDWGEDGEEGAPAAAAPPPSAPSAPQQGQLSVSFPDPLAQIELFGGNEPPQVGTGSLPSQSLTPGIYRLRVRLPGVPVLERSIEVRAGSTQNVALEAPAPQLSQLHLEWLGRLGMILDWDEKTVCPAETLGIVGGARLASLLAFAAYAAQEEGRLRKLRAFGVGKLPLSSGEAGVVALVGSAHEGEDLGRFLSGCRIVLRRPGGEVVDDGGFVPLDGMPAAAQHLTVLEGPSSLNAELHLGEFAPTRYALAALPGRVCVLVAVAESNGSVEVQQYLLPAPGSSPVPAPDREYVESLVDLRRLEMAQTFYAAGRREAALAAVSSEELDEKNLKSLLRGKWLDPLLGCLAGYVLVGNGRASEFLGRDWPDGSHSALRNLLLYFPEFPDVHVLAGLCDPVEENRPAHFERAIQRGLPVFSEGARALAAWARRQGAGLPPEIAEPLVHLLPGSPWTAWDAPESGEERE